MKEVSFLVASALNDFKIRL